MSSLTGLIVGDAPKAETLPTPPASMVDSPTGGVMNDPSKETAPASTETPKTGSERPSWLPEQFKTPEDLAKAYTEIRTKMDSKATATPAPKTDETPNVDMSAAEREYAENGKVSDATLKALAAKGMTSAQVDTYFAGQAALAQQARAEFAEIAGGDDALTTTLAWAKTNLTQAEAAAYDAAVNRGDKATAKMLFQNIVNRYVAANGRDPKLVSGATVPGGTGAQPFANWAQVQEAMSKPQYKTDEAYRQQVRSRLEVSNI
jgi:hypothetical protein